MSSLLDSPYFILTGALLTGAFAGYHFGEQDGEKKLKGSAVLHDKIDTPTTQMAFIVRTDLGMSKGKSAAQVAHAALACYELAVREVPMSAGKWRKEGQQQVVLQVGSENELLELKERADKAGLITRIIQDAGRTQIDPGSLTVLGIGPAEIARIEKLTLHLKLF